MKESKGITCKLRNGTEVLLSEGDRVLALRMVKGGMPITVDADYIIDEVLATLAETQEDMKCWLDGATDASRGYGYKWKQKAMEARIERNDMGEENIRLRKEIEKARQVNIVIKEALGSIWANSDDQGAIDCAADALDTVKLIGKLKVGDKAVQKSTGTQGVLIDIQYEHNRYQFADISGWMYHIADLEQVLGEEVES